MEISYPRLLYSKVDKADELLENGLAGATEYPRSSVYAVQEKAWMDKRVFVEWIEKVWKPFCENKSSTYLLMDEFLSI